MCMITYVPANIEIPWAGIENGAVFNDDGHGWAVASKKGLVVGKSMDYDIAALELAVARDEAGPDSLVLFHSRFATHGKKTVFNVHPFYVDNGQPSVYDEVDEEQEQIDSPLDTVMAHNGILPAKWQPTIHDVRSDTRIFGDRVGRAYTENGVPSRRGGKAMGAAIGSGNKLVFLTAKDGQPKVRIVNAHLGVFTEGVWYSNDGYLPSTWRGYSSRWDDSAWASQYDSGWASGKAGAVTSDGTTLSRVETDTPQRKASLEDCPWCGTDEAIDAASDICMRCEVCLSCTEWMGDCMCYLSEDERESAEAREAAEANAFILSEQQAEKGIERGKAVELWTPDGKQFKGATHIGSPLNPEFRPAEVGIEV